jgi:hypothetical protein
MFLVALLRPIEVSPLYGDVGQEKGNDSIRGARPNFWKSRVIGWRPLHVVGEPVYGLLQPRLTW